MNGSDLSPDKRAALAAIRSLDSRDPGGWIQVDDKDTVPDLLLTLRELAIAGLIFQPREPDGKKPRFEPKGWRLTAAGALAAAESSRARVIERRSRLQALLAERMAELLAAMAKLDAPADTNIKRLGSAQRHLLRVLAENSGASADRIVYLTRMARGQLSNALGSLSKRNLVRGVHDGTAHSTSGSRTCWELTELGLVAFREIECETAQKLIDRCQEGVEARDREIAELTAALAAASATVS